MYKLDPLKCFPGDTVERHHVADWPKMTNRAAVAFKMFTGIKNIEGQLHRQGPRIFEVGDADLALCRYNHTREF
jgi:hypothetical protein